MSSGATLAGAVPIFPVVIDNPPGRSAIDYRVGDYSAFRDALLQSLPGEVELQGWRPTEGDLALQLLEWWAYLADILTFYSERIANASYLGTAVLPPSLQTGAATPPTLEAGAAAADPRDAQKIARVVGFRPTPGIAATGKLGVLVSALRPITIAAGFAVQNKPGPGQKPQVFEADASSALYLPTSAGGAVPIDLQTPTTLSMALTESPDHPAESNGLLLRGTIASVKAGDMLVVAELPAPYASATSVVVTVTSVAPETDPRGRANTRVRFAPPSTAPTFDADVKSLLTLRSIQSAPVYSYGASAVQPDGFHLASLFRNIDIGDLVVLEDPLAESPETRYVTATVTAYAEAIWYANASSASSPESPPTTPAGVVPVVVAHAVLGLDPSPTTGVTRVWYAYRSVGAPLDEFVATPIAASAVGSKIITPAGTVATSPGFPKNTTVLLEGADGIGAVATLTAPTSTGDIALASSDDTTSLVPPLRVLFNVMNVTAGKTVASEVLGNGDSTASGQSFTLQNSPLTYVAGKTPAFPSSTLEVFVNGVAWTEVPSFSGQPADAKIFVTQEDPSQRTIVTFGDGVHGARLATGTANVTASYRYGSGPGDPGLGGPAVATLVTVLTPQPGLGAVRNPVAMTGGAAPPTASQVQASAPASALTLGSAVSASDYEAIASQAPRVTRVRSVYGWSASARRALTTLYVDGGADAVTAAAHAIAQASDPNVPIDVQPATEIDLSLTLVILHDPTYDPAAVQGAVVAALTDPGAGPLAPSQIRIGDPLYTSALNAACTRVPGVLAVHGLTLTRKSSGASLTQAINFPGSGGYFSLAASDVTPTMEAGHG